MIALRMLLERERDQLRQDLEQAEEAQQPVLQDQLAQVSMQLDAITQKIEAARPAENAP